MNTVAKTLKFLPFYGATKSVLGRRTEHLRLSRYLVRINAAILEETRDQNYRKALLELV